MQGNRPDGRLVQEEQIVTVERLCRAHRIRYSKHFFPQSTADLRQRLFGEREKETGNEQGVSGSLPVITPAGEPPGVPSGDGREASCQVSDEKCSSTQDACQPTEAQDGKKVGETPGEKEELG